MRADRPRPSLAPRDPPERSFRSESGGGGTGVLSVRLAGFAGRSTFAGVARFSLFAAVRLLAAFFTGFFTGLDDLEGLGTFALTAFFAGAGVFFAVAMMVILLCSELQYASPQ